MSWPKTLHGVEVLITIIFLVAICFWIYEPTRAWVIHNLHLSEKPTEIALLAVVVNGAVLLLFLLSIGRFEQKLGNTQQREDTALTTFTTPPGGLIRTGVMEVYNHIREILNKRASQRDLVSHPEKLEVLGLTLFSAWPQLRAFLNDPDVKGWDIFLFCLAPNYIGAQNTTIPDNWKLDAEHTINEIRYYVRNQGQSLRERTVSLTLTTYSHFPGLHGFRIGETNGDLLFSLIDWSTNNFILYPEAKHHFYEHIAPSDESDRANLYRRVFDSWISRASRTGQQIAIP